MSLIKVTELEAGVYALNQFISMVRSAGMTDIEEEFERATPMRIAQLFVKANDEAYVYLAIVIKHIAWVHIAWEENFNQVKQFKVLYDQNKKPHGFEAEFM